MKTILRVLLPSQLLWSINSYTLLKTSPSLARGQIMVEGPFNDASDSVVAITSGSGEYSQARGSMTLHARSAQGSEYDFVDEIIR